LIPLLPSFVAFAATLVCELFFGALHRLAFLRNTSWQCLFVDALDPWLLRTHAFLPGRSSSGRGTRISLSLRCTRWWGGEETCVRLRCSPLLPTTPPSRSTPVTHNYALLGKRFGTHESPSHLPLLMNTYLPAMLNPTPRHDTPRTRGTQSFPQAPQPYTTNHGTHLFFPQAPQPHNQPWDALPSSTPDQALFVMHTRLGTAANSCSAPLALSHTPL
jgi:hypothetical protein